MVKRKSITDGDAPADNSAVPVNTRTSIEEYTTLELKAIAYEETKKMNIASSNVQIIEQELLKRKQQQQNTHP